MNCGATSGWSNYNIIQDWTCPGCCPNQQNSTCWCVDDNKNLNPEFIDPGSFNDAPATFEFNNYRLIESSRAINFGDPDIENGAPGYFPPDVENVDGDGSITEATPEYDLNDRVYVFDDPNVHDGATRIDAGAYEAPCFVEPECDGDCVTSATFQPPGDGYVDGADLAYLLGQWGPCEDCCSDWVTSSTFQPPPDGKVDGADMAYLFGVWNRWCCDFEQGSPAPLTWAAAKA